MRSYYKEPEITKEVMDENGVVYTNDLGYLGEDGLVYLLGRQEMLLTWVESKLHLLK